MTIILTNNTAHLYIIPMEYLRYCAVLIPFFSIQVWLRSHLQSLGQPIAMVTPGFNPTITHLNPAARRLKITQHISINDLRKQFPMVRIVNYDHETEQQAIQQILLTCSQHTPQVQSMGHGLFLLDLAGTARLHGQNQHQWLHRFLTQLSSLGYNNYRAVLAPVATAACALVPTSHPLKTMIFGADKLHNALGQVAIHSIPNLDSQVILQMRATGLRLLKDFRTAGRKLVLGNWGATGEYLYALSQGIDCKPPNNTANRIMQPFKAYKSCEPAITLRPMLRNSCNELAVELQQLLLKNQQRCSKVALEAHFSDGRKQLLTTKVTTDFTDCFYNSLDQFDFCGASIVYLEFRALQLCKKVRIDLFDSLELAG